VAEGLHITSMAGTWMSVVQGFGGMRWEGEELMLEPRLPAQWSAYAFHLKFRSATLEVQVSRNSVEIEHKGGAEVQFKVYGQQIDISPGQTTHISRTDS